MTRTPATIGWRFIGHHPEGNLWAAEIPTGVLIRFTYLNEIPETATLDKHAMTFVPGLFIVTETDSDGDRHARLEVIDA